MAHYGYLVSRLGLAVVILCFCLTVNGQSGPGNGKLAKKEAYSNLDQIGGRLKSVEVNM